MKKTLDALIEDRLNNYHTARLKGGIVGGTEATPNEYPWQD